MGGHYCTGERGVAEFNKTVQEVTFYLVTFVQDFGLSGRQLVVFAASTGSTFAAEEKK